VFNNTFQGLGLWCSMPLSTIFLLVLLVEENGVPRENHRPVASHRQIYQIMLYQVHHTMSGIRTHYFSGDWH
jgi:hypothetical protein